MRNKIELPADIQALSSVKQIHAGTLDLSHKGLQFTAPTPYELADSMGEGYGLTRFGYCIETKTWHLFYQNEFWIGLKIVAPAGNTLVPAQNLKP